MGWAVARFEETCARKKHGLARRGWAEGARCQSRAELLPVFLLECVGPTLAGCRVQR